MAKGLTYRPDIDGLRALAVLPVVFYHAGFATFSGGFVGVDVFFVISGFLITSLIYKDIRTESFSYQQFYMRRIRRLFPALFAVVIATCVAAYGLLLPRELQDFGQSVVSIAVFASNFLFWNESGYFAEAAEMKPLLHTWSLAIEEQYYLVFPVLLLLVGRLRSQPYFLIVMGLTVLSFAVSALTVFGAPDAAFYLLPSRMWELLLGSLLALKMPPVTSKGVAHVLAAVGLLLIGSAVFLFDSGVAFPGVAALAPCVGTALIIMTGAQHRTWLSSVLSLRPLVFVGLISYSLYLWHWPVFVFAKHYWGTPLDVQLTLWLVLLALLLSVLSWRFIEQPFRGAGAKLSMPNLFRVAGSVAVALVLVGLIFTFTDGLPNRLPAPVAAIAAVADERPVVDERCQSLGPGDLQISEMCQLFPAGPEPTFLIWGDSHASMLLPALRTSLSELQRNASFAVANGCAPLLGVERVVQRGDASCSTHNTAVFNALANAPQIETVILIARWGFHAQGVEVPGKSGVARYLKSTSASASTSEQNRELFRAAFSQTLQALNRLGKTVVVMGGLPEASGDVPEMVAKAVWHSRQPQMQMSEAGFLLRQDPVYEVLAQMPGEVEFIELYPSLCDNRICQFSQGSEPWFFDDNHLSQAGVQLVTPLIQDFFADLNADYGER